jgi:uncharacterized protein YciI
MYILHASFSQSPEAVAPHIPAHAQWVKKHIESGHFLMAGPKKSGLGGVALARSMPKSELLALLQEDSYVQADVVDYQIIDLTVTVSGPQWAALQGV